MYKYIISFMVMYKNYIHQKCKYDAQKVIQNCTLLKKLTNNTNYQFNLSYSRDMNINHSIASFSSLPSPVPRVRPLPLYVSGPVHGLSPRAPLQAPPSPFSPLYPRAWLRAVYLLGPAPWALTPPF